MTLLEITQKLRTLTTPDIDLLMASLSGANTQDTPNANVNARVANLLNWAQSSTGVGLQMVEDTMQMLFFQHTPEVSLVRPRKYLPYERNVFFTGREGILKRLHQDLAENNNVALTQAIAGLGGIGKTQTAIEYAYTHWDDYDAIFWCPANSVATLNTAYHDIAVSLDLPQKDAPNPEDTNYAVKAWLASNSRYLLILDNADDPAIVKKYLPWKRSGHILVTSRAKDFDILSIKGPIRLYNLPADEALTFLLQRTERENTSATERTAATKLADELGYLPLALEQAGAYIVHHEIPFAQYLAEYKRLRVELLDKHGPITGDYPETVRTTWNQSFMAVRERSQSAAELLTISAFFAPDAIPYELLLDGVPNLRSQLTSEVPQAPNNPLGLQELLSILADYSLIRRNTEAQTYDIHRMVQAVIHAGMGEPARQTYVALAALAIHATFPDPVFPNWRICERLLPHALVSEQHIESHQFRTQESACMLRNTGWYLRHRARYEEAVRLLQSALEIFREVHGPKHHDIATTLNYKGRVYRNMGRYDEAVPLLEEAVAIGSDTPGKDHPDFAEYLDSLGRVYYQKERYDKAEPLILQALSITKQTQGKRHRNVANRLHNLANVYTETGRYKEARMLLLRALAIDRRTISNDDPDCAVHLRSLAAVYIKCGRTMDAEPLMMKALAISEQVLGTENPYTAYSYYLRGLLREQQGDLKEAEIYLQRTLEIWERTFGPQRRWTMKAREALERVREMRELRDAGSITAEDGKAE